jgi:hypothetical protein
MFKITDLFKKFMLSALALAMGPAVFPLTGVSAANLGDGSTPPANQARGTLRLESIWAHEQLVYQRQGDQLGRVDAVVSWVQDLVDEANARGGDTSAIQAALDAFSSVIPAAQSVHESGATIITNHAGFDVNGKVTDRATAFQTAQSLNQVLKDTRSAMNGTGQALRDAIRAFRQAHRPTLATTTP